MFWGSNIFFISLILFNSKTSLFLFNSSFLSWPIPCSALIAPPKILTLSKTILFIELHIDFLDKFCCSLIETLKCKLLSPKWPKLIILEPFKYSLMHFVVFFINSEILVRGIEISCGIIKSSFLSASGIDYL